MGTVSRTITMFFENRVGPFDWYEDHARVSKLSKDAFLSIDRAGKIKDFVLGQISI